MKRALMALILVSVLFMLSGCMVYTGGMTDENGIPAATYDPGTGELTIPVVVTWSKEPQIEFDTSKTVHIDDINIFYGVTEDERNAVEKAYKGEFYQETDLRALTLNANWSGKRALGKKQFCVTVPMIGANDTITFFASASGNGLITTSGLKSLQIAKLKQTMSSADVSLDESALVNLNGLPSTGDTSSVAFLAFLTAASFLALCVLNLRRREE